LTLVGKRTARPSEADDSPSVVRDPDYVSTNLAFLSDNNLNLL